MRKQFGAFDIESCWAVGITRVYRYYRSSYSLCKIYYIKYFYILLYDMYISL